MRQFGQRALTRGLVGSSHWEIPEAVDSKTGETSTKNKSAEERVQAMADRAGGFPSCLDPDALVEFIRSSEVMTTDTTGEEGDRHMWSEYLLMFPPCFFLS